MASVHGQPAQKERQQPFPRRAGATARGELGGAGRSQPPSDELRRSGAGDPNCGTPRSEPTVNRVLRAMARS